MNWINVAYKWQALVHTTLNHQIAWRLELSLVRWLLVSGGEKSSTQLRQLYDVDGWLQTCKRAQLKRVLHNNGSSNSISTICAEIMNTSGMI
jgi:hypothetical protein